MSAAHAFNIRRACISSTFSHRSDVDVEPRRMRRNAVQPEPERREISDALAGLYRSASETSSIGREPEMRLERLSSTCRKGARLIDNRRSCPLRALSGDDEGASMVEYVLGCLISSRPRMKFTERKRLRWITGRHAMAYARRLREMIFIGNVNAPLSGMPLGRNVAEGSLEWWICQILPDLGWRLELRHTLSMKSSTDLAAALWRWTSVFVAHAPQRGTRRWHY